MRRIRRPAYLLRRPTLPSVPLPPRSALAFALVAAWTCAGAPVAGQVGLSLGGAYAEPAGTPRYAVALAVPIPFADAAFDVTPYGEYSNGKWKKGDGPSPSFYSTGIDVHLNLPVLLGALRPFAGIGLGALGTHAQTRAAVNFKAGAYVFPLTRRFFPFVQGTYRLAGAFAEPNLFDTISVQGGVRLSLGSAY